jgi:Protein of unknown function (DUF3300)
MKAFARIVLRLLLALALSASVAFAQTAQPARNTQAATQAELDQLLAPIALYPDTLLSQILMASTYPLEVVEAARWSRANSGLRGNDAVSAVEQMDWDASVKALVAFPQVLAMMDERLDWTERLGDVFILQEPVVMETVQSLRQKAYAAGNLRSSEQAYVYSEGNAIAIEPASPEVVYVPYYDPWVVYGTWWWPAYPPVYWAPWPGYYVRPGIVFAWGFGITIGPRFFFSACDWRQRHVTVVTVDRRIVGARPAPGRTTPTVWQHDPGHRRGVPYRIGSLEKRYGPANVAPPGQRRDSHWRDSLGPATRNSALNRPEVNPRPSAPGRDARPSQRRPDDARFGRPEGRPSVPQGVPRGGEARPESRGSAGRPVAPAPATPGPQAPARSGNAPRFAPPPGTSAPRSPASSGNVPQAPARSGNVLRPPVFAPPHSAPGASGRPPQQAPGAGAHRAPPAAKSQGEGRGR